MKKQFVGRDALRLSRTIPDFLFGLGCVYGADTCASAAVSAETCVDYVFSVIADRNSACGTFSFASAAADANIILNCVCHSWFLLCEIVYVIIWLITLNI